MLKSLKIQSKLLLISSVVILLGVLIAAWGMVTILRVDKLMQRLAEVDRESSASLGMSVRFVEISAANLAWVMTTDERYGFDIIYLEASVVRILERAAVRNADDPETLGSIETIQAGLLEFDERWPQMVDAAAAEDWDTADTLAFETMDQLYDLIDEADQIYYGLEPDLEAAQAEIYVLLYGAAAVALLALIVFAVIAFWAGRTLTTQMARPLAALIEAATAMEAGTFEPAMVNTLCERRDEIGRIARSLIETSEAQAARQEALLAEATELRVKLARQGVEVGEMA
jgi:nitrate/nitrite-specific signal transduction histidine kinase